MMLLNYMVVNAQPLAMLGIMVMWLVSALVLRPRGPVS